MTWSTRWAKGFRTPADILHKQGRERAERTRDRLVRKAQQRKEQRILQLPPQQRPKSVNQAIRKNLNAWKQSGRTVPETLRQTRGLSARRSVPGGGSLTVNRQGLVTERNENNIIVQRFQTDTFQARQFITAQSREIQKQKQFPTTLNRVENLLKKQGKTVSKDAQGNLVATFDDRKLIINPQLNFIEVPKSATVSPSALSLGETITRKKLTDILKKEKKTKAESRKVAEQLTKERKLKEAKITPRQKKIAKRAVKLKEREKRLTGLQEVVFKKLKIAPNFEKREQLKSQGTLVQRGTNFAFEFSKAVARFPFELAGLPLVIGGRAALAVDAAFDKESRKILKSTVAEVPGEVVRMVDPRTPEGLLGLIIVASAVRGLAKGKLAQKQLQREISQSQIVQASVKVTKLKSGKFVVNKKGFVKIGNKKVPFTEKIIVKKAQLKKVASKKSLNSYKLTKKELARIKAKVKAKTQKPEFITKKQAIKELVKKSKARIRKQLKITKQPIKRIKFEIIELSKLIKKLRGKKGSQPSIKQINNQIAQKQSLLKKLLKKKPTLRGKDIPFKELIKKSQKRIAKLKKAKAKIKPSKKPEFITKKKAFDILIKKSKARIVKLKRAKRITKLKKIIQPKKKPILRGKDIPIKQLVKKSKIRIAKLKRAKRIAKIRKIVKTPLKKVKAQIKNLRNKLKKLLRKKKKNQEDIKRIEKIREKLFEIESEIVEVTLKSGQKKFFSAKNGRQVFRFQDAFTKKTVFFKSKRAFLKAVKQQLNRQGLQPKTVEQTLKLIESQKLTPRQAKALARRKVKVTLREAQILAKKKVITKKPEFKPSKRIIKPEFSKQQQGQIQAQQQLTILKTKKLKQIVPKTEIVLLTIKQSKTLLKAMNKALTRARLRQFPKALFKRQQILKFKLASAQIKQAIKLGQVQELSPNKQIPVTVPKDIIKNKQIQEPIQDQALRQKPIQETIPKEKIKPAFDELLRRIPAEDIAEIPREDVRQIVEDVIKRVPEKKKRLRRILKRLKDKKKKLGYDVFLKKQGAKRYTKVNSGALSISHARNMGRYLTDNTPRASYRLKFTRRKITQKFIRQTPAKKFRQVKARTKLPQRTVVEKRKFRIDTKGEKAGITIKGLKKLKTQKSIIKAIKSKVKKKTAIKKKKKIKKSVKKRTKGRKR